MRRRLGILVAGLALAGCASEESARRKYEPILGEHLLAESRSDAARARRDAAAALDARETWSVRDCIEMAFLYNDELKSRGEDYYQAVMERDRTLALYLPTLVARATYFRQEFQPANNFGTSSTRRSRDESLLRLRVPIFSGGREYFAIDAADDAIDAAGHELRFEKSRIALAVVEAYFDILRLEASRRTLEKSLETQRERRREIAERVDVGVARRTELLLVEAQLAGNEAAYNRAGNDLVVAREQLAVLIGSTSLHALADETVDPEPTDLDTLTRIALDKRRDLEALVRRQEVAAKRAKAEVGSWLPTLAFTGNLYGHRDGSVEEVDWDLQLESEINLFEGGGARARLAQARSEERQAALAVRARRLQIGLDVKREYHLWKSLTEDLASLQKEEAAADENHRLLLEEYRQRLATNLEVELALDQLLSARLALDAARLDRRVAWFRIQFVTGQLP